MAVGVLGFVTVTAFPTSSPNGKESLLGERAMGCPFEALLFWPSSIWGMTWLRMRVIGFLWIWRLHEGRSEVWGQGTFQCLFRSGGIRYVQIGRFMGLEGLCYFSLTASLSSSPLGLCQCNMRALTRLLSPISKPWLAVEQMVPQPCWRNVIGVSFSLPSFYCSQSHNRAVLPQPRSNQEGSVWLSAKSAWWKL